MNEWVAAADLKNDQSLHSNLMCVSTKVKYQKQVTVVVITFYMHVDFYVNPFLSFSLQQSNTLHTVVANNMKTYASSPKIKIAIEK